MTREFWDNHPVVYKGESSVVPDATGRDKNTLLAKFIAGPGLTIGGIGKRNLYNGFLLLISYRVVPPPVSYRFFNPVNYLGYTRSLCMLEDIA